MTDNNGSYIKAPEDNKSNIQTMTPWGKAHAEKEAQKKAAPQKQTSNEAHPEIYVMAPKDKPLNTNYGKAAVDAVAKRKEEINEGLKNGWKNAKANVEKKAEQAAARPQDVQHDKMVRILNYMNKVNGVGKTVNSEEITGQLIEKFGEKALELLTMAVNEPSNFAQYIGDASIKTSRQAISALCQASEQNADQALMKKEMDLKSILKTQAEIKKTVQETQKTIDRINNSKAGFNIQNPLSKAVESIGAKITDNQFAKPYEPEKTVATMENKPLVKNSVYIEGQESSSFALYAMKQKQNSK